MDSRLRVLAVALGVSGVAGILIVFTNSFRISDFHLRLDRAKKTSTSR